MSDKAVVQVAANDITPVTLTSEDSNQISQAELAMFSLNYANKIKNAVDNPSGGGGTKLKGYNAVETINNQIRANTENKLSLDIEKSYAEVVTNGDFVFLDFVLWITSNGETYKYTNKIDIQLDSPLEKILSPHIHYINTALFYSTNDHVSPVSSYPCASVNFAPGVNKIIFSLYPTTIPYNNELVYNVSIPIFMNIVAPVTKTSEPVTQEAK